MFRKLDSVSNKSWPKRFSLFLKEKLKGIPFIYNFVKKYRCAVTPKTDASLQIDGIISYAQQSEDIWLYRAFKDNLSGFYVDIGANDPTFYSVSKLFYDRGWNGINVEPNPDLYAKLQKERIRDINVNYGISNKEGTLTLYIPLGCEGAASVQKNGICKNPYP